MSEPIPPEDATRPSVDDVARLIRARTKDDTGKEVGTFTEETRPTAAMVEEHITSAGGLVSTRFPALDTVDPMFYPAIASIVAYRAALQIEKSYFPEQVQSNRSAYEQLRQEYNDDLGALTEAIAAAGGVTPGGMAAGSEHTPSFLSVYGKNGEDDWPEPENPANWRDPLQPPRQPPAEEDLPVGDEPASGVWVP